MESAFVGSINNLPISALVGDSNAANRVDSKANKSNYGKVRA